MTDETYNGVRYLADLVDRAPPAANAPDYARAVYDLALRRDLIRQALSRVDWRRIGAAFREA